MKEIKKDIMVRVYLVYLGILIFSIGILAKAFYIQSFEGEELMEKAKKQEMRLFDIEALRGNICSDDGTLLATSIPIFEVRMDVSSENITEDFFRENVDSLSFYLSRLFKDKSMSDYRDLLWDARRNGERYTLIHRDITYPELKQMRLFPIFRLGKYRGGMIVIPQYQRELPYKSLAKRTIGFENAMADTVKYVGIEGSFTKNLQGIGGKRLMRRVGGGAWMPVDIENQVEPQNGQDIITTIDINLQDLAESALRRELRLDSAHHGCVIVMEVKTGHVKAIANLGRSPRGGYDEVFNYAIGEATEPGSTFKLASFLVGMEDGKIRLDSLVNVGNGTVNYAGRTMKDSHKGLGTITAESVFEHSSNVGTSKLIYRAYADDPQRYIDGLYRMSINRPLGLQLGGEARPYIKNTASKWWSALSLPWMSIGYEVALSPLQILTLYNAIANNGVMVKPLFVKEIRKNGQVVQSFPTQVINKAIVSPETVKKARYILEGVVQQGTATSLKNPLYKVAGKTGTAQIAQTNRGYKQGTSQIKYKGSFVGYFPADNPRYSIIVVINEPSKGKYYGGAIAAPVFKEIADRIYAGLDDLKNPPPVDTLGTKIPSANAGLQKDLETVYSVLNIPPKSLNPAAQWARPALENASVTLVPEVISGNVMPDVTGMGVKDAVYRIEQLGMRVMVSGVGTVKSQSVKAGLPVVRGGMVSLELGRTNEQQSTKNEVRSTNKE